MRICLIAERLPCPPTDGTPIRILSIGRALKSLASVRFVYAPGPFAPDQATDATRAEFPDFHALVPPHPDAVGLCNSGAYGGLGPTIGADERAGLEALVKDCDLVWIERLDVAHRVGLHGERCIVDLDDLRQQLYRHAAKHSDSLHSRLRLRLSAWRWQFRESRCASRFKGVAVCSEEDRKALGGLDNVRVIANAFVPEKVVAAKAQRRIGFIGTLEYWANRQGLAWFLREVWPGVRRMCPDASFRIVGRGNALPEFDQPGVEALGYLEDSSDEWATWSGTVVPLLAGSGTRIKILEAFSRGCPVVSTPVGAYGLLASPNEHCLIASDAASFADAVVKLLEDGMLRSRLTAAAHDLYLGHYTQAVIETNTANWISDLRSSAVR